ncbi:hypothetical protein I540_3748 [Mycobacteroides abscessus subsp. bolletii 1513]|uniref:Uncharacterized protein n=1 Tax=Mycobacteroides abscessus subsp. bolletii 1513 TaxID=1299321 RepID=X8DPJ3_9MYCO|nr:hypothetical protein I540_3748 [Mycobacteroides abscessus subsp. bolletii 1513]
MPSGAPLGAGVMVVVVVVVVVVLVLVGPPSLLVPHPAKAAPSAMAHPAKTLAGLTVRVFMGCSRVRCVGLL